MTNEEAINLKQPTIQKNGVQRKLVVQEYTVLDTPKTQQNVPNGFKEYDEDMPF